MLANSSGPVAGLLSIELFTPVLNPTYAPPGLGAVTSRIPFALQSPVSEGE